MIAKEKILKKKIWLYLLMGICFSFLGIDSLIEGDSFPSGTALVLGGVLFIFLAFKEHLESRFAPRLINILHNFLSVLFICAVLLWILEKIRII